LQELPQHSIKSVSKVARDLPQRQQCFDDCNINNWRPRNEGEKTLLAPPHPPPHPNPPPPRPRDRRAGICA
jgi:hypothetical protein